MTGRSFVAWVVLGALAGVPGVGRSEPPPAPPASHPPRVVAPGSQVQLLPPDLGAPVATTVPAAGGLYLDPEAWRYQVELRRFTDLELQICKGQVESTPPGGWKPWVVSGTVGVVVGAVGVLLLARAAK